MKIVCAFGTEKVSLFGMKIVVASNSALLYAGSTVRMNLAGLQ